jgi:hypothetical protein
MTAKVAINPKQLKEICKRPVKWFWKKYTDDVIEENGRKCIYIDNGSDVLAVAHLDTVIDPRKSFNFNEYVRDKIRYIKCPALDDRLGVYIITVLMPTLLGDHWADILLTDGEETGNSTADLFVSKFKGEKEYNWMVEFDRSGGVAEKEEDAVLYSYQFGGDADKFKDALKESGYKKLGRGSFTDISSMQDMKAKAFNVAVGYYNNHTTKAYVIPYQTEIAVEKFLDFYVKNYGIKYEHTVTTYSRRGYDWRNHTYGSTSQVALPYGSVGKSKVAEAGVSVHGALYFIGDLVYHSRYGTSDSVYMVKQIYKHENGGYSYDISSLARSYSISLVREEFLDGAVDVCTIALSIYATCAAILYSMARLCAKNVMSCSHPRNLPEVRNGAQYVRRASATSSCRRAML